MVAGTFIIYLDCYILSILFNLGSIFGFQKRHYDGADYARYLSTIQALDSIKFLGK